MNADLDEAATTAQTILSALMGTLAGGAGDPGAKLFLAVQNLKASATGELAAGGLQFWIDLTACFDLARLAGATFVGMDAVRATAEALTPSGLPAIALMNFAVRMALVEQARIIAATTFTSRQDIDAIFDVLNESFDTAITVAADGLDNQSYVALTSLYAAVSNDLATRSRPLPRMVTYQFATSMPALWLAQRIYADPTRSDELIAENKPIHPLFCQSTGVCLSA